MGGKNVHFLQRILKKDVWIPKLQNCESSRISAVPPSGGPPPKKQTLLLPKPYHIGKGSVSTRDRSFVRWLWIPKVSVITFLQTATSYWRKKKIKLKKLPDQTAHPGVWRTLLFEKDEIIFHACSIISKETRETFHISSAKTCKFRMKWQARQVQNSRKIRKHVAKKQHL